MKVSEISLFTGVGGFSLAAALAGWDTVAMCEINPYSRAVLDSHWPGVYKHDDVKTFNREEIESKIGTSYRDGIVVLTGGFPCQPVSHSGLRRGDGDDRWLWPEMFAVARAFRPDWIVAENVAGILTFDGGRLFDTVCADLEGEGYEVLPVVLPALSVGAPHRRDRVWFIAHRTESDGHVSVQSQKGRKPGEGEYAQGRDSGPTSYGSGEGLAGRKFAGSPGQGARPSRTVAKLPEDTSYAHGGGWNEALRGQDTSWGESHNDECGGADGGGFPERPWDRKHWLEVASELCRVDDGLPEGLDKTGGVSSTPKKGKAKSAGKQQRIEALGNAIVWQVAYEIFNVINQTYK